MKKILIFAGTTEGRRLSEYLAAEGIPHTVCVATEYGELVMQPHPLVNIHTGRMDREQLYDYLQEKETEVVVDATHPYARTATEHIRAAAEKAEAVYLRLRRETAMQEQDGRIRYFDSHEACAKALEETEGNILLTTGSKELSVYCAHETLRERLYVRVLPGLESLQLCAEQGIRGRHILALQGPFSVQMNQALCREYQIGCIVTKKSGRAGGYPEKVETAVREKLPLYVIGQEQGEEQEGVSYGEVCKQLMELLGREPDVSEDMEILLAGAGMGNRELLTGEVQEAVAQADFLCGAERLIAGYCPRVEKKALYTAGELIPFLENARKEGRMPERAKVVVLFSGDTGFYSGCQKMYRELEREIESGAFHASVRILPGISSVAYLAACVGESYQDVPVYSIHGRKVPNLPAKLRRHARMFLLLSGAGDMRRLGELLQENGLEFCEIYAGYQLSYPEQKLLRLTAEECALVTEEGLYTCMIRNPHPEPARLTHGRGDAEFLRDRVPMTKEEVREISICKLRLSAGAVVWDIGSGTGSIAVEIAGLSDEIQVYAIEKKGEAAELIRRNREHFGLENIRLVETEAPGGLMELPMPTHAFIGGSGGRMREILDVLYRKNPKLRIVINAVSMETICEIREILDSYPVEQEEIVQLQVARCAKAGEYHLLRAENPVFVCAFTFSA